MKKIILVLTFSAFSAITFAQKQTFDLVTYTPPKGWKKEVVDIAVGYSIINKKDASWCQIAIYKSLPSKGSIELDFDSEWQMLVINRYKAKAPTLVNETQEADGWKIKAGGGSFMFNKKNAIAMLTTFSGYNTCFSILATCNNEKYIVDIQNFIASLELNNPVKNEEKVVATDKPENNSLVIGSWGKSNSVSQLYNRYGTYSYNKQQYTFNTNGTYSFLGKNYSEDYAETILIKETGVYSMNGNVLTITPKTSVIESWSKKNGADNYHQLKSRQKRALENASYQAQMDGKNLILSTSKETTRDGRFSNGNYYSYGPPETFTAIKLPE
ncbi:MAG: hypothetical protein ACYC0A_07250 [Lutibacter sp.]